VRAFGRRPADAAFGVDAELVRLDEPGCGRPHGAAGLAEPCSSSCQAGARHRGLGSIGSNQRCMPPCSALYSTGCQCARCGTCAQRAARSSATKQEWRRRR
jgi:hypothetical protein